MSQRGSGLPGPGSSDNATADSLNPEARAFVPGQLSDPRSLATSSANATPVVRPAVASHPRPGAPVLPPIDTILGPQGPPPPPLPEYGPGYIIRPPDVPAPESDGSDDSYDDTDDDDIPVPPWVGLSLGPAHWEETALRDASTWESIRPEPIGHVPHKALPNFEDPRWTGPLSASYVPYWTGPLWDMNKEEDWRGEVYMARFKPKDRYHYGRPAILQHPIDEWVKRSDYAL